MKLSAKARWILTITTTASILITLSIIISINVFRFPRSFLHLLNIVGTKNNILISSSSNVGKITINANNKLLAVLSDQSQVEVWDTSTKEKNKFGQIKFNSIQDISFDNSENYSALFIATNRKVSIIDISSKSRITSTIEIIDSSAQDSIRMISPSHKSNRLALLISKDQTGIRYVQVWDTKTKSLNCQIQDKDKSTAAIDISEDGETIATLSATKISLIDVAKCAINQEFEIINSVSEWVDAQIIRKLDNSENSDSTYDHLYSNLSFNANFQKIFFTDNATINILDINEKEKITKLGTHANESIQSMSVSSDNLLIASGGTEGTIKIWNSKTKELTKTFKASKVSIRSITFTSDNKTLISVDRDGLIRFWELGAG